MGNRFHIDVRAAGELTVGDFEWATVLVQVNLLLKANDMDHIEAHLEEYDEEEK